MTTLLRYALLGCSLPEPPTYVQSALRMAKGDLTEDMSCVRGLRKLSGALKLGGKGHQTQKKEGNKGRDKHTTNNRTKFQQQIRENDEQRVKRGNIRRACAPRWSPLLFSPCRHLLFLTISSNSSQDSRNLPHEKPPGSRQRSPRAPSPIQSRGRTFRPRGGDAAPRDCT